MISIEQPPETVSPEESAWLMRMFHAIDTAMQAGQMPVLSTLPQKPQVGKLYFFKQAIPPNIAGEGFYGYTSTGWVAL